MSTGLDFVQQLGADCYHDLDFFLRLNNFLGLHQVWRSLCFGCFFIQMGPIEVDGTCGIQKAPQP